MQTNTTYRPKAAPAQFEFGTKQEFGKQEQYKESYAEKRVDNQEQHASSSAHTMPIKSFKSGSIQVSIWENETLGQDGLPKTYKTVSFDRRYKDKSGVWKSTNSLRLNDLPRATLILQKAYEYLILVEHDDIEA